MPDITDPQILERALGSDEGDEPPASGLIRALDPIIRVKVLRVLLRFGRGTDSAKLCQAVDGLVRDVWARLRQHGHIVRKWTPACGVGLLAWVGLVAQRHVLELLCNRQPPIEGPLNHDEEAVHPRSSAGPEIELASKEMLLQVIGKLRAELNPRGAAIFELSIIEEHPVQHVCTVMEMTEEAVFQWRSRIARRARDLAKLLPKEANRPPTT